MARVANPDAFRAAPAALLVDLDNTLYAYDPCHAAALARTRDKAAQLLAVAPPDFDGLYARARVEVKARLGATAAAHSRLLYFQRLIELAGLKTQALIALDLEQTYWRAFLNAARLFDGVTEFLDDLRLIGAPVAVVTDLAAQIQFRKLVHFGIDHAIDYVVTSEEAGADKPARAPFALARDKIGAVAGPVWFIGDDPDADIGGAAAASGLVMLQKRHAGVRAADRVDASFETFGELRRLLARLVSNGHPAAPAR
jgi:putative hydrolase of the HAD superfamily